jgi:hypothetical protein
MTVYLIAPGTSVAVSNNGSDFRLQVLRKQLQIESPPELTATDAVFTAGKRRIRVARSRVIIARFDGQGGVNEFGL